jgi:hypothetical protein
MLSSAFGQHPGFKRCSNAASESSRPGCILFSAPVGKPYSAGVLRRLSGCTHRVLDTLWCLGARREEHVFSLWRVSFAG